MVDVNKLNKNGGFATATGLMAGRGLLLGKVINKTPASTNKDKVKRLRLGEGVRYIEDITHVDPAKDWLYEVVIGNDFFQNKNKSFFVLGGKFPLESLEKFSINDRNTEKHFPENYGVSEVELEVLETDSGGLGVDGNMAMDFFYIWRNEIMDEEGYYHYPVEYKKDIAVWRLDKEKNRVMGLEYSGCWVVGISDYEPKSDSSELLKFTVTLSVDSVKRIDM